MTNTIVLAQTLTPTPLPNDHLVCIVFLPQMAVYRNGNAGGMICSVYGLANKYGKRGLSSLMPFLMSVLTALATCYMYAWD